MSMKQRLWFLYLHLWVSVVPDVPVHGFSSQGPCREVRHSPHYCKSDPFHMVSFPVQPAGKLVPLDSSRGGESSSVTWGCSFFWYTGGPWDILSDAILSAPSEWGFLYLQIAHYSQGHDWHGISRCCYLCVWTVSRLYEWLRDLQAVWDCKAAEARYGDHGGQSVCCGQPCSL